MTNVKHTSQEIKLQLPISSWSMDSPYYELIIKDDSGTTHYFNKDGSYDGWSKDTEMCEN